MVLLNKLGNTLKRYSRDEEGAFSIIWGVSAIAFLAVMGAALDFTLLSSANSRAQSVADTAALAAAIYVRDHGEIPENRNEGLIGSYSATELGYNFKNWVIDGGNGVSINVVYDETNKEAIVTASGSTRPLFMQMFGHEKLDFSSETVVKFEEKEPLDPASIVLVMDNSGSMHFDDLPLDNGVAPTEANVRMDGLKSSANAFMNQLDTLVGPQVESDDTPRVLRTGMITFDTAPREDAPMAWGVVGEDKINNMQPRGGTDSSLPLGTASDWLTGPNYTDEPQVHDRENPGADPLKYLILMTDGRNTAGTQQWVAREGTQNWRAFLQADDFTVVAAFVPGGQCRVRGGYSFQRYRYEREDGSVFNNFTSLRVECRIFEYEYRQQTDEPTEAGDWEEGEFDLSSNIQARRECDELHAAGVEIFTIGFALEPGQYETNTWATNHMCNYTPFAPTNALNLPGCAPVAAYNRDTAVRNSNIAEGLLQYCANKDENFISADDTAALTAAFEKIGNTIVKEIIRIDS